MEHYNLIVCGGTFDYLHEGHKAFLRFMLSQSKKILLGLTSDSYTQEKTKDAVEPYFIRKNVLEAFLNQEQALDKVVIESIDSVYIPSQWEKLPIEAIIVSKESQKGADLINNKRRTEGLQELPVVVFPLVEASAGGYISSTRIRNGEINREGKPWIKPVWLEKSLRLPEEYRSRLTGPFGELISDFSAWTTSCTIIPEKLITVGDVITKSCNELEIGQAISVIDFHTQRQKTFTSNRELGFNGSERVFSVSNPSSHITSELFKLTKQIFFYLPLQGRIIIEISGEEDLAVLPFLLAAPLGYTILYGQPKQGVVKVDVTETTKEKAYRIVDMFTVV